MPRISQRATLTDPAPPPHQWGFPSLRLRQHLDTSFGLGETFPSLKASDGAALCHRLRNNQMHLYFSSIEREQTVFPNQNSRRSEP